jgi:CheY-like chemotaxis protein
MAKILVVDDSPDILLVLSATFENAGHEVLSTASPHEVLAIVERDRPDACVFDVMMPEITGLSLLEEMRQRPDMEGIPVVLLTALSAASDRIKGLRTGADDYQVKPFDPDELLARVEGLIVRRDVHATGMIPIVEAKLLQEAEPSLSEAIAKLELSFEAGEKIDDISLGRYQVVDLLGTGAMGTVFRGFDPKLKRSVALKTIRFDTDQVERRTQVTRLLEEAVVNARVNHPNIVTVYDFGDDGASAFIAMELVEGESLETYLNTYRRVPPNRILPLAAAMTRATAASHASDVVHRDIKPGNVLLGTDATIKVTDFGISELISKANRSEAIFGTPGYLAPECLSGGKATGQSDLFAIGVVLYEAATGTHPFIEKSWRKTLHKTVTHNPPPLHSFVPEIPEPASEMIRQLLEKEEAARPESAEAVAKIFEDLALRAGHTWKLGGEELGGVPPKWRRGTTRSRLVPRGLRRSFA